MFNKVDRVNDKSSRVVDILSSRSKIGGNKEHGNDVEQMVMSEDELIVLVTFQNYGTIQRVTKSGRAVKTPKKIIINN